MSFNQSIEILILHDPNIIVPEITLQNVAALNLTSNNQFFSFHYINMHKNFSISTHFEPRPSTIILAYLLVYRFDGVSQVNQYTGQTCFWPLSKTSSVSFVLPLCTLC